MRRNARVEYQFSQGEVISDEVKEALLGDLTRMVQGEAVLLVIAPLVTPKVVVTPARQKLETKEQAQKASAAAVHAILVSNRLRMLALAELLEIQHQIVSRMCGAHCVITVKNATKLLELKAEGRLQIDAQQEEYLQRRIANDTRKSKAESVP